MERVTTTTTVAAYTTAGATAGISWLHSLLNQFSQHEWTAIGVLISCFVGMGTFVVNWYYQAKRTKELKEKQNDK